MASSKLKPHRYTALETAFLKLWLPAQPRRVTAERFAERFGWRPSEGQITNFVTRHGCQGAPNAGRFRKGQGKIPGSGAKAANRTSFKPGQVPRNHLPLWSERWRARKGGGRELFIKVPGRRYGSLSIKENTRWERKASVIWKMARGPLPASGRIVHLDGDPANCRLENLACITGAELAMLNRHCPPPAGPEAEPSRVALARLLAATGPKGRREAACAS